MKVRLLILVFALFATLNIFAGTKVIAHRGYWKTENSAQNSRASLINALIQNVFGSEIDVWLTTDGKLMVNHDGSYQGVTIQKASSLDCKKLVLKNGERMPRLKELLKILKRSTSSTKLIIEIKEHESLDANLQVAQKTVRLVKKMGVKDRVEYISFNLEACKEVHRCDPKAQVAYLGGDKTPTEVHELGLTGIDYNLTVLRQHPDWIAQAHAMGMTVNAWTVNKKQDIQDMINAGVDYLTTDEPVLAKEMTKK